MEGRLEEGDPLLPKLPKGMSPSKDRRQFPKPGGVGHNHHRPPNHTNNKTLKLGRRPELEGASESRAGWGRRGLPPKVPGPPLHSLFPPAHQHSLLAEPS